MLSLFGLEAILEYLEANKRIHITARSPSLRNKEKAIPLHIENLVISEGSVQINDISYLLQPWFFQTKNLKNDKEKLRHFPLYSGYNILQVHGCFLAKRSEIDVEHLQLLSKSLESLPGTIKFHPRRMQIQDIKQIYRVASSQPLAELKIPITIPLLTIFENQHVKSSEKLIIVNETLIPLVLIDFFAFFNDCHHANVILEGFSPESYDIYGIIQNWFRQEREIGTKLRFERVRKRVLNELQKERVCELHQLRIFEKRARQFCIRSQSDVPFGVTIKYSDVSWDQEWVPIEMVLTKLV